jgi:endonuclease/exonuclease/phosphatase (EEP) superfamily protein YafD
MHSAVSADVVPNTSARRGRAVLIAVAVGVLLGSAAGFIGGWHWLLDLTTHFRWYWFLLALGGVVLAAVLHRPATAALFAAALAVNAGDLLPYWIPPPTAIAAADHRRVRVVSMNVHRANRRTSPAIDHVRGRRPDVLAVLEVDDRWATALAALADVLPHRMIVPRPDNFGIALLSRWPLVDARVVAFTATGFPSIVATVRHEAGDFRFIATHPYPPFDGPATAQLVEHLDGVAAEAAAARLPCVVAGDLNAAPWSRGFRRLVAAAGLRDTALGRGVRSTYHAGLPAPRIPIDHILVPTGTVVVRRSVGPDVGSDHFPVEADVILP